MGEHVIAEKGQQDDVHQLKLVQTQLPNKLPKYTITQVLSNDRMPNMKNVSFSGLDFLERPPPEAMLVSVVHAIAPGQVET